MPRIARIKVKGEPTVYHVMPRTALDGFVIGDVEKDFLLGRFKSVIVDPPDSPQRTICSAEFKVNNA